MNYLLVVDDSAADRKLVRSLLTEHFDFCIEEASNGWEAIEYVEDRLPLAVVTDLLMPEINGLELTETMHRRFPRVPVILMTSAGTEDVAADALARGASDFIPKSALSSELCRAVEAVLSVTGNGLGEQRICQYLSYTQSRYELESDLLVVPPLVQHLERTAHQLALVDDQGRIRLAKALREAISNAICHGNLELTNGEFHEMRRLHGNSESLSARRSLPPYNDRRVTVDASISGDEGRFIVRDDGPGFDTSFVETLTADRSRLTSNERRGLVLMKMFMDEVTFNDRGNEVTMVKRKPAVKSSATNARGETILANA